MRIRFPVDRRLAAIAGCAIVVAAGSLGGASAATAPGPGSGPVKAPGLTAAERKALQIVSVRATGVDRLGVVVTATFAGDIERSLGRGHLRDAVVALLLRPKSSQLALSGLATTGPGVLGTTIRKTRSNAVGVVRNGRKLIFFVGGPGFGNVGEIVVKAFVKQPKARKLQTAKPVSASWWELIDRDLAAAESALPAPGGATSCEELKAMRQTVEQQLRIAADRAALLQKTKREIASELGDLGAAGTSWFLVKEAFLHSVGAPIGVLLGKGTLPEVAADRHRLKKTLELDAKLVDAALERNAALIAKLEGLAEDIDLLISDCRDPWLQLSQVRAEFDQASFTTTYTVTASILNAPADDVVTYEWSVSIPADQKCAEGFRGGYPKPNQATWYHAEKSEGGPCGHTGTESGPRGHPGTVTVTAADRFWICRNSYLGTQGDNGATSGVQGIPSCDVR